jgi:DNA-binding HxlR family transcriptional regulator
MGEELLDPLIHTQARLRIMTTLTSLPRGDRLTFPRLQALVEASAGNLSTHLRRLEEAGYVEYTKSFQGRVPRTEYRLTAEGRRALERYLDHMEALIRRVREP